tara:strand:+ start:352 stop:561 length:210 start_codon:yes stop_codon:yes gene_type:complete
MGESKMTKKFTIHMVEKHYSKFEVEAENIEEAKDIIASGINDNVIVEIKNEFAEPDVVTEYYDSEWNEI